MNYTTTTAIAAKLSIETTDLPANAEHLITVASEMMDAATQNRLNVTNADIQIGYQDKLTAMADAVAYQMQFWMENGEDADFGPSVVSYTASRVSQTFGDDGSRLAPRARQRLLTAGLLSCGVSTR